MLTILKTLPDRFLSASATELTQILPGPTLLHLAGRRAEPLFVSILLHGNEDVGLQAVQKLLSAVVPLPRSLSIFVGNVVAARAGVRRLENQPDYNRVWPGADDDGTPEHALMRDVVAQMRSRQVFASIDLHNNTGTNPHYACVNRLEAPFLHLASFFSRTVVYFQRPRGVQSMALAALCPAITCECGKVGDAAGVMHAAELIESCLNLHEIPSHPVAAGDIHLFHTVATVKVSPSASFSCSPSEADLVFPADLESLNFQELPPGALLARRRLGSDASLEVRDEQNREVSERFLEIDGPSIRLRRTVMPSMLTSNEPVIRQECLCYFMERCPLPES
ncbi:MAG TPA: M14 family metallopeptidase [Planctomycetaceae bacterium]|nr:M14 family metallopeptidase [Planctomycetaceae bacterium]